MKWNISCDFASGFGIVDFAHEIAWLILKVQNRRVVKHSVAYVISRSSSNRLLPIFDMNIIKINGIGIWRNHTIQKCCIKNRIWWLWCKCNAGGFINPIFDTNLLFPLLVQYEVRISEIVLSGFQNKNLDTVGMSAFEENSIEGAFVRHIFFDDYALRWLWLQGSSFWGMEIIRDFHESSPPLIHSPEWWESVSFLDR